MKRENVEQAVKFLENINKNETVTIIHHWDMDGTSSAVITSKILEKERGKPVENVKIPSERAYHLSEKDHQVLKDTDKLIVLDFNLDAAELEDIKEEFNIDILVVDHHSFDRVPEGISFVNPRAEDAEVYVPCSKLCLDIAEKFNMEDDIRWIAGLGIIQDFGVESCPELFEKLERNYDEYLPKELNQEQLAKNCEYGRYSSVLNIKPYKNSQKYAKLAYKALMNSEDLKELEAQEEYRKVYKVYLEMQEEFNRLMENYEEERKLDRDKLVIFFEIESDFHITSSIATNMSTKTPEWIHIVTQKNDKINISARCQSGRVDLGDLLYQALPEEAVEDGAEAGGHRKAAGASMKPEYYEEFKENFLELL
ncbi:MAG: DHH family phosphoesterase [Candidatus Nanohaloarchaea archaeon]